MTSLVQAKTINSSGVYVVGHVDTKSCSQTEERRRLSFNDVIRLTVPTKDGSEKVQSKTYSVDELKDLQSKLMLIAGKAEKGKDEVEQFVKASLNLLSKRDRKYLERIFKFKVGNIFYNHCTLCRINAIVSAWHRQKNRFETSFFVACVKF